MTSDPCVTPILTYLDFCHSVTAREFGMLLPRLLYVFVLISFITFKFSIPEATTWNGTAGDTVTCKRPRVHVGSYMVPVGTGGV